MTSPQAAADGRLAPVPLPDGGLYVPGPLTAELAGALELLDAFVRGTPPPSACRAPKLTRVAASVLLASRDASIAYRRRETQRTSAAPTVTFLPAAQLQPLSDQEMVTTAKAAEIVGVSPEWIRRLASTGRIRACRAPRNTWLVDLGDVRTRHDKRTRSGNDAQHADPDREAEPGAA